MQIKVRVDLVSSAGRHAFAKVDVPLSDTAHAEASNEAVSDRNARSARNDVDETWTATGTRQVIQ